MPSVKGACQKPVHSLAEPLNPPCCPCLVTLRSSLTDILPGQGLYFETLAQSWRARNCDGNEYGVDKVTYGLSAFPCRGCPLNMVASTNRTGYPRSAAFFVRDNATGAQGFTSPLACVNQAGEWLACPWVGEP